MSTEPGPAPTNEPLNPVAEFNQWYLREVDRGSLYVVAPTLGLFAVTLATFGAEVALILIPWLSVYPIAIGATQQTVVLGAIFAALSVFLVELRTFFTQGLLYRFLTRPKRDRRKKTEAV